MVGRRRLEKEAKAGNADAQYSLAAAYATGEGFELDLSKAVEFYSRAAKQGHSEALYNLGLMRLRGEGTGKNLNNGVANLMQAAKLGSQDAMEFVADALAEGRLTLKKDGALAAYYYLRGLAAGNIHSPVSLAISLKANNIRNKDIISALLKLAVEEGSVSAGKLLNSPKFENHRID